MQVCGRVYCSRCVKIGMGEMVEGRKCIECLGLKFSQRYISNQLFILDVNIAREYYFVW